MNKFVTTILATMLIVLPLTNAEAGLFTNIDNGVPTHTYAKAVNNLDDKTITFTTLPTSAGEVSPSTDAHQVAAYAVAAIARYAQSKDDSIAMLNVLRGPRPLSQYNLQFLRDRYSQCPYTFNSYFKGATPQNNYTANQPYQVVVESNPYTYQEAGYAKFYLHSGGADSSRPIVLRQKASTGEWFLWEYESLLGSIRIPAAADPWA